MKTNAGNLKKGEFIEYQGDIWQIQKAEFYSPGKGSALMKTKIKGLTSGKTIDYTFKSSESIETLAVESIEMQFLYKDNDVIYFMDERTYNQYELPIGSAGNAANFLKEGEKCYVYLYQDRPLTVRTPLSVSLKIVEADDATKGDTVSGAKKQVTLETGAKVMVPIFVKAGETITVNPDTGEYTGRDSLT